MKNHCKQQKQFPPVRFGVELNLDDVINALEDCAGDLALFESKLPNSSMESQFGCLFRIVLTLEKPGNESFKQRWEAAIDINIRIRLNLLVCKALSMAQQYPLSETNATVDFAFIKLFLGVLLPQYKQPSIDEEMDYYPRQASREQTEVVEDEEYFARSAEEESLEDMTPEEEEKAEQELQLRKDIEYQEEYNPWFSAKRKSNLNVG